MAGLTVDIMKLNSIFYCSRKQ